MTQIPSKLAVETWARLFRTQKILLDKVEIQLKAHKLPPLAWYDVLLEIYRAPDKRLRQFEIGEKILLSTPNVSRLLDRMEKQAYLVRIASDEDRRANYVSVTETGINLLQQIWGIYQKVIADAFAQKYTIDELKQFNRLLQKSN